MPKVQQLNKKFKKKVSELSSEWLDPQPAWLGNRSEVVETGTPGIYYARLSNGKVVEVYNSLNVPPTFDLHVKIGRNRTLNRIWQIIEIGEDFDTPAASGQVAYHHLQHEFSGGDRVNVDRKQILALSLIVSDSAGFKVYLYGGVFHSGTGITLVPPQEIDFSSDVVSVGAVYVSVETDDTGAIYKHTGTNFGAPAAGGVAYIATPAFGRYIIGYVLLYEGQAGLLDEHIRVVMPLGIVRKTMSDDIPNASADTPLNNDEFGFWDVTDLVIKKITWSNIKGTLKTYFDTLYAALVHTHAPVSPLFIDGLSNPLVPAENDDGTDWVYPD